MKTIVANLYMVLSLFIATILSSQFLLNVVYATKPLEEQLLFLTPFFDSKLFAYMLTSGYILWALVFYSVFIWIGKYVFKVEGL